MKHVVFVGDSLKRLRDFLEHAKQDAGFQRDKVQRGQQPVAFKPAPSVGKGVEEIRVWDDAGTYRVVYPARLPDAEYVLHALHKKAQAPSKRDIEIAGERLSQITNGQA